MSQPLVRWGILGCGKIARKFAADLRHVRGAQLSAVAARSQAAADQFAQEFPPPFRHGDYESLVKNPEVDVIYVATPHAFHHAHTLLCLQHGKAVLCEKAFAINLRQAREMIDLARTRQVFLMEAFWTKFLPHYRRLKAMIAEGRVGHVQSVIANFGFIPTPPVAPRLYDPALGGGALLDIGVYPVFLALDLLGKPDRIEAMMSPSEQHTDRQCAIQFHYDSGAFAQLFCTFTSNLSTGADIGGDAGRLRLTHRFHGPTAQLEYYPGIVDTREVIATDPVAGHGYEYEAQHVTDCVREGRTESPVMTFADTLLLMETLDTIRAKAGLRYPADDH